MRFFGGDWPPNLYSTDIHRSPSMNPCHASLPLPITLGAPLPRRLSQRLADLLQRALDHHRDAERRRAERRLSRTRHALYSSLDARTLRDIGLGEWAGPARDGDAPLWHRDPYQ
jgi:hypothetical protein